jgi:hypothetical protein
MKLATILAFDRELIDDSPDSESPVIQDVTVKVDDVKEFEEDMVEAA